MLVTAAAFGAAALMPLSPVAAAAPHQAKFYTFVVSSSGSDRAPGTATHPWRTIQHAVDVAPMQSHIVVRAGRYPGFTIMRPYLRIFGAGRRTVVSSSAPGDVIRVAASHTLVSGLTVAGCTPRVVADQGYENAGSSSVSMVAGSSFSLLTKLRVVGRPARNEYGLPFGCFGVSLRDVNHVRVTNSDLSGGGYGVFVLRDGLGDLISGNNVHDNNVLMRNNPGPHNDFGAIGIGFMDAAGIRAENNTLTHNVGPSWDWGTDGGGFEIYSASLITMRHNRISNNDDVLETGGRQCSDNVFTDNTAQGRTPGSSLTRSVGLLLRCATDMSVTNNRLTGFDWWTFDLPTSASRASTQGLTITGNHTSQRFDLTYSIDNDLSGCGIRVAHNSADTNGRLGRDWLGRTLRNSAEVSAALT